MTNELIPCARGCAVPGTHRVQHVPGALCTGCGPRAAMRGTPVCAHCATLFATAFRDLRTIWPDLVTSSSRPRTAGPSAGRVHTSNIADLGDYWRPDITQLLTDARAWLAFLTVALSGSPSLRGYQPELLSTEKWMALLELRARPLLIEQPAIAEGLVKEALRLRARAYRVIDGTWVRRVPLPGARCISDVYHDDPDAPDGIHVERCGGDLVGIFQPLDAGGDSAVVCSRYPREHRIAPEQWDALAEQLDLITQ